jgi:sensor histidine kinase YesM
VEISRLFYDGRNTLNRTKNLAFHKRSVFLINPGFQIRFSIIVCSLIFLSSLIYPLIFIDFFDELVKVSGPVTEQISIARNELIFYLFLIQFVFILIVFIMFIFITHKIAGPMYKLKQHLMEIRHGEPIAPISFRTGDHFQDVAEEVSLFLESVAYNQETDFQHIEEVAAYIDNLSTVVPDDKRPVLNEISRRLLEIKSRYKASV